MHGVATMCRVWGVSTSGYYAWRTRARSERARADAELSLRIQAIHQRSRATYGAPRIHAELADQGIRVGCKRVARLMEVAGIYGVSRRKWITTTTRDRAMRPAPDLVERNFSAPAPNELWVADLTYIPTWTGFLYLAVVLDVFSRRVVGWAMETHLRTELVLAALNMALGQRRPADVIHHSDQGTQYTSIAFGTRCQQAGVRPRWVRSAIVSTTRWRRAFSPPWNASCSSAAVSKLRLRRAWRSLTSSRVGTIPIVATPRSATSHRSITNAAMQMMPIKACGARPRCAPLGRRKTWRPARCTASRPQIQNL